jgi:hypothetical protein
MTTVERIKAEIDTLAPSERAELVKSIHGWTDDAWDEQMKRDFDAGKFDALLREVEGDLQAGRLEDGP